VQSGDKPAAVHFVFLARSELCVFSIEVLKQSSKAQRNSCNMRVNFIGVGLPCGIALGAQARQDSISPKNANLQIKLYLHYSAGLSGVRQVLSSAAATLNTATSSKAFEQICKPVGTPLSPIPEGTEMAGHLPIMLK